MHGRYRGRRVGGLLWMAAGVAAMWIAVNFLGLYGNSKMRRELGRRIGDGKGGVYPNLPFVGCATPTYAGWLDPHEDVGFLRLEADRLVFQGDRLELVLMKADVTTVRYRPNVHTLVGLGRWISVEGISEGTRVRIVVEPRVKATLLGNLIYSKKLRSQLESWLKQGEART